MPDPTEEEQAKHHCPTRSALDLDLKEEEEEESVLSSHSEEEEEKPRNDDHPLEKKIAQKEAKRVGCARWLLVLVLVAVTTGVSVAVYTQARGGERADFENQYYDHAHKVTGSFRASARSRLRTIESFAVSISVGAAARGEQWPNVSVPEYVRQAMSVIELSKVMSLTLLQIVTNETRPGWEAYTASHNQWVYQSLAYHEQRMSDDFDHALDQEIDGFLSQLTGAGIPENQPYRYEVFDLGPDGTSSPPSETPILFPWWQSAPQTISLSGINYNALSHPTRGASLKRILQTEMPLVAPAADLADSEDPRLKGKSMVLNQVLLRLNSVAEAYEAGPISDLYFPIFEAYEDENYQELPMDQRKMVAVLTAYVYWEAYFEDILPDADNAQGVVAILENTCGQQFTYIIHGSSASYVGPGDLHDIKYDGYAVSTGFGAFLGEDAVVPKPQTTQVDKEKTQNDDCIFNVRVYPSRELEDAFMTDTPRTFTLVVVCVFLGTSLIFFLYDRLVEKRQRTVMKKAVQSTEVVHTLYPETVRSRLFTIDDKKTRNSSKKKIKQDEFTTPQQQNKNEQQQDPIMGNSFRNLDIVADLYENCTVLFADLAGFTSWCSGREPKHVFELLEAIYGEFDQLAKRRRVFKIATIGDCYLAITGVPRPQTKHALIMARFAAEAMERTNEIIHHKLVHTLGEDTAGLVMRVGLHSGPVTAGVLRGDRSRFELFGDTVNVASRMESNGQPGKIQASKATADLIAAAGKGSWLTKREGGVQAKGKGTMETYWVNPNNESPSTTTATTATTTSMDGSSNECSIVATA